MSMSRNYRVDTGLVAMPSTTPLPILYFAPTSTNDLNIFRLKCTVEAAASNTPVSNASVLFSLNLVTGTKAGGAAVTPRQLNGATLAANTVCSSGSVAITALTQSTEFWASPVPFAAGAAWEDAYENTGLEINVPASGTWALYAVSPGGTGTNFNVRAVVDFSE